MCSLAYGNRKLAQVLRSLFVSRRETRRIINTPIHQGLGQDDEPLIDGSSVVKWSMHELLNLSAMRITTSVKVTPFPSKLLTTYTETGSIGPLSVQKARNMQGRILPGDRVWVFRFPLCGKQWFRLGFPS